MARALVNFVLSGAEADKFGEIEKHIQARPGKPPTRADIIKALMGIDPYGLMQGWERDYLTGNISAIPVADKGDHPPYGFEGGTTRAGSGRKPVKKVG